MSTREKLILTPCTPAELPQLNAFLDKGFTKPSKNWFVKNYPHIFQQSVASAKCHHIYKEGKTIKGCVGVYPMPLRIGSAKLVMGGLGQVAVDPACRGQGLMSAMLTETVARIRRQGYDLCWLSGNRFRYRNYGWDHGGRNVTFLLEHKALARMFGQLPVCTVRSAKPGDIGLIQKLYSSLYSCALRSAAVWRLQIKRPTRGWLLARGKKGAAYCGFLPDAPGTIFEIAGEPQVAAAMLDTHMRKFKLTDVRISMPEHSNPLYDFLCNAADSFFTGICFQVNIINPEQAFKKLLPELRARFKPFPAGAARLSAADKTLILWRALGFFETMPALPQRLKAYAHVRPLGWWMSDADHV